MTIPAYQDKASRRRLFDNDLQSQANAGLSERDTGNPSARTTSKGALIGETHAIFRQLAQGKSLPAVKAAALRGTILRNSARHTRARIWDAINWRFFSWKPPGWVLQEICDAVPETTRPNQRFVNLVYVHYARRDRLTFDFVAEWVFGTWSDNARQVRPDDVWRFAVNRYGRAVMEKFRESTRKKIAGNVLTALRDFGVLRGARRKTIERPRLDPTTALHLCRLLHEEGLRGRELIEASDWRLFLLSQHEVTSALAALGRQGAVRFEQAGRTVILELPER